MSIDNIKSMYHVKREKKKYHLKFNFFIEYIKKIFFYVYFTVPDWIVHSSVRIESIAQFLRNAFYAVAASIYIECNLKRSFNLGGLFIFFLNEFSWLHHNLQCVWSILSCLKTTQSNITKKKYKYNLNWKWAIFVVFFFLLRLIERGRLV